MKLRQLTAAVLACLAGAGGTLADDQDDRGDDSYFLLNKTVSRTAAWPDGLYLETGRGYLTGCPADMMPFAADTGAAFGCRDMLMRPVRFEAPHAGAARPGTRLNFEAEDGGQLLLGALVGRTGRLDACPAGLQSFHLQISKTFGHISWSAYDAADDRSEEKVLTGTVFGCRDADTVPDEAALAFIYEEPDGTIAPALFAGP